MLPFEGNTANDKTYTQTAAVPFVAQQDYTGIVRTRSNIQDLNLENNIGYADALLTISAPTLLLDTPTVITLSPDEQMVFKIESIPAGETLVATLTTLSTGDVQTPYHDLFLRFGQPPTGFDHDAFSQYALTSNQTAVVRNTKLGTYYIGIQSFGGGSTPYDVNVLLRIAKFEIFNLQPSLAAPLGNVTILFSGTLFSNTLQASLVDETTSEVYAALNYYWFNSEEVYATFDSSAIGFGNYTARLTNQVTGGMASLSNSFRIANGIPGQPSVTIRQPESLQVGSSGTIEIFLQNTGNTDILTPLMTLRTQGNAVLQYIDETNTLSPSSEFFFLPLPSRGPGGIIPPGGTAQVHFRISPSEGFLGREALQLSYIEDTEEPHVYLQLRDSLRPNYVPTEVWDTIWSNFLDSVGTSWSSLHRRVSEVVTQYSLVQKRVYSVDDVVNYQLRLAYGFLTGTADQLTLYQP